MSQGYVLVFDRTSERFDRLFDVTVPSILCLGILSFGLYLCWLCYRTPADQRVLRWRHAGAVLFVALVTLMEGPAANNELQATMGKGGFRTYEGCLEAFNEAAIPRQPLSRPSLTIRAGGRCYPVSNSPMQFPDGRRRQPLYPDSRVKITYADDQFLRLEVQDGTCRPAPENWDLSCQWDRPPAGK